MAKKRKAAFNSRPFFRFLVGLLHEVVNACGDDAQPDALAAFAATLRQLQPVACPAFAFAWLELASHRLFMPKLLMVR